ncbi:hypothetical protein KEM48_002863 [Puccinia striiformis f. sp. tritici PST-130]|uniref:Uncharacterized protein n=1 Tax=Puccinia striiformis f. sp. tritici PST-78 TaxID=1165861 RepID=A0A0L0V655_9BASI|nr:hypothetical protein KEM48_002863 [Puccinia striiformis f. sp. tritici PST-130]KNE94762.1 hypothetical protein PSTG_11855 [Puccinia striiformis f. sp. tritici PST-78]
MTEFLDNKEFLESYRARLARGEWPATLAKANEMFQAIDDQGKAQRALAAALGNNYAALCGQCKSKLSLLSLLWKAKSDLYKLAVAVHAEKEPVITTDLDKQIRQNQDLTLADFKAMDLIDPLWNNNHFYHAWALWALDPNARKGIKSVFFLYWVEEEVELLNQELDRSIDWACEYHCLLRSTIAKIDLDAQEPIDPNNEFADILPTFTSMKGKL